MDTKVIEDMVFGRLKTLRLAGKNNGGYWLWECLCECGNTAIVKSINLRNGQTRSCGCLARESTIKRSTTHGLYGSKEYWVWTRMKSRCNDPRNPSYLDYGARGISVCDRWTKSFVDFLKDMGTCPDGMSLDRKDSNGNYDPDNCKWSDIYEQNNNRRNNVVIVADGKTMTLAQWSRLLGVRPDTLRWRLKSGKKIENMKEYQNVKGSIP